MDMSVNNIQNSNSLWPVLCPVFYTIKYNKGDDT